MEFWEFLELGVFRGYVGELRVFYKCTPASYGVCTVFRSREFVDLGWYVCESGSSHAQVSELISFWACYA